MGVVVDGVVTRGVPYFDYTNYRALDMSIMVNWTTKHIRKPTVIIIMWNMSLCHPRGLCGSESRDIRILNSGTKGLVITEHATKWALSPLWKFLPARSLNHHFSFVQPTVPSLYQLSYLVSHPAR